VPAGRQTMLFSATMPGPIVALARTFLNQPIQIRAETDGSAPNTDHIDQFAYRAHAMDKVEVLARILQARNRGLTLIFTRTKRTAAKVADDLADRGFAAAAIHGDLGQGAREQALRAFRSGKVDVLVATDVAARGLDVEGISHVINYHAPEDEMNYVHRIGRTARAGASGTAVTLVDWDDIPRWKLICDKLGLPFHAPSETYSTSEHLYLELDIPREAKGSLPRSERTRAGLDAEQLEDLGGRAPKPPRDAGRDKPRTTAQAPRPKRPASDRERRRTRGGTSADRAPAGGVDQAEDTASATSAAGVEKTASRPRHRRRRTGSASGAGSAGTATPGPAAE